MITLLKKINELPDYVLPVIVAVVILSASLIFGHNYFTQNKYQAENIDVLDITQSPKEPTHTPTPTTIPATPTLTPIPYFPLKVSAIDYSKGHPNGFVTHVNIKLYGANGELIQEKLPTPYVTDGPLGTGGDALFYVPLGTYRAEAETNNSKGSVEINLKSFQDSEWYSLYLELKHINFTGKYFLDGNRNGSYDSGEQVFQNKKVNAVANTEGGLYTVGEGVTDNDGNFSFSSRHIGTYYLTGENDNSYGVPERERMSLSGGENITYNLYVWPL